MSERISALLLALCVAAVPLRAQRVEQLLKRQANLEARLAALDSVSAQRTRNAFDRQARTVLTVDGVSVALPTWAVAEARTVLPGVVAAHRTRYGASLDSLLKDTLVIWIDDAARAKGRASAHAVWKLGAVADSADVWLTGSTANDWISWIPARAIERWSRAELDSTFSAWLGTTGSRTNVTTLMKGAVRDLLASPSTFARACLTGSVEWCQRGLDLTTGGSSLERWYLPADIPGLFVRWQWESSKIPGRAACISGGDLALCAAMLRNAGAQTPRATSDLVHESLYVYALETGGDLAWLRLHGAAGRPVADQLAVAAGIPIDSLLAGWQHELITAPGSATAGLGPILLLALAWAIAATLFSAWRFRWRHV